MVVYNEPTEVEITTIGCCVRFGTDGVYLHENETHAAVGINSIKIDSKGRLEVSHRSIGKIVTMGAFADETLVARHISLGCSGGGGTTIIVAAKDGRQLNLNRAEDYALISGDYANAWLLWVHARPKVA